MGRSSQHERLEDRVVLAAGVPPEILGTVYDDANADGSYTPGEELVGVGLQLALDNGDEVYRPGEDEIVDSTVTGDAGDYFFTNLDPKSIYFVIRPPQNVDGQDLGEVISSPISPGQPNLVIDQFRSTQIARALPPAPSTAGSVQRFSDQTEVIGAERDLYVELLSGPGDVTLFVDSSAAALRFEIMPEISARRVVTWDGIDGQSDGVGFGLNDRDLTGGGTSTGIVVRGRNLGAADGVEGILRIYQSDAATFSEAVFTLPEDATEDAFVFVPFDSFVGTVSPTAVDAIQMIVAASVAAPVADSISSLGAIGPKRFDVAEVDVADLSVTKANGVDIVASGQPTTYVITVRNEGPQPVFGAAIVDEFSDLLTDVVYTSVTSGQVDGNTESGTGDLNDVVDMVPGSSVTYTVRATVAGELGSVIVNQATVTPPGGILDPDLTNNVSADTDTIGVLSDLQILQRDGVSEVTSGQEITYEIVIRNAGPSDVTGVRIVNTLPAGLRDVSYTSWVIGTGDGNTESGVGAINDVVEMSAGSFIVYVLSGRVATDASGVLTNSVRVLGPESPDFVDADPTNNLARDVNTVSPLMVLGSRPVALVPDRLLEPVTTDRYKVTAHSTGTLRVTVHMATPDVDARLAVDDRNGNPILTTEISGNETLLIVPVVSQETYYVRVIGGSGESSTNYDLEIENFTVPVPSVIGLDADSDSGMMNDDAITSASRPTILVQADLSELIEDGIPLLQPGRAPGGNPDLPLGSGVTVQVTVTDLESGDQFSGPATSLGDTGELFTFTPSPENVLSTGQYSVTAAVRVFDGARADGQPSSATGRSEQSAPFRMTIDRVAPVAADQPDMLSASDTGRSTVDNITSKMRPAFRGNGDPNVKVRVVANRIGGEIEVVGQGVTNADGSWEITIEPLDDDVYHIRAEFEDLAGNISSVGEPLLFEVDTIEPNTPYLDLLRSHDTGLDASDNVTSLSSLAFSMTTQDPRQDRHWYRFNYNFRLFIRPDAADGQSPADEILVYDSLTDDEIPPMNRLDGLTDLEQLVRTLGPFPDGVHNFKLEVEDRAGNVSPPFTLEVEIRTELPIISGVDLADFSDSGMSQTDNVTAIFQPAILGVGTVGDAVTVYANGELVGSGTVNGDISDGVPDNDLGAWEITLEPLDDDVYEIVATIEDSAGNIATSQTLTIEVDTLEPNTPFLDLMEISDRGRNDDDNITNVQSVVLSATTSDPNPDNHLVLIPDGQNFKYRIYLRPEQGVEVLLYESAADDSLADLLDGLTASPQVLTPPLDVPEGLHSLKLEVEDRAGNISHDFLSDLLIDRTAFAGAASLHPNSDSGVPGIPETFADGVTNSRTPWLTGTAEANSLVTATIDGVPAGTAVAIPLDGDDALQPPALPYELEGNWLLQSTVSLENGVHDVVLTFEDPAGNRASDQFQLIVDTAGPRIVNVTQNVDGFPSLFDPKPTSGPDPLIDSIVIRLTDSPLRSDLFPEGAIAESTAGEEGNYVLTGDANGNIPIVRVEIVTSELSPGGIVTQVILFFNEALPDDRFTLTVSDSIRDLAGNQLDGESGARAPFEGQPGLAEVPPIFPTGDGVPGGPFVARFTVDSRPEVGTWAAGSVWVDINGNFTFDPNNNDFVNRDIVYRYGFTSDDIFAGNFALAGEVTDGYDKLAAYGRAEGEFRWLVDTDNDGVPNIDRVDPLQPNGLPVAGRFDNNGSNGDEVGVFDGKYWYFDIDHDFRTDIRRRSELVGYPIVGDFDGDGFDDLGSWADDRFMIDLAEGRLRGWDGFVDEVLTFGFIGVGERPVVADLDQDGFDDFGLWAPNREGVTDRDQSEWYFLVSDGQSLIDRFSPPDDPIDSFPVIDFTPIPFGPDVYARFGDRYALPIVGNFDPPTLPLKMDEDDPNWTNSKNPLDVNSDDIVSPLDMLLILNELNQRGAHPLEGSGAAGSYPDVNQDGYLSPLDALLVSNELNRVSRVDSQRPASVAAMPAGSVASAILADQVFADLDSYHVKSR